jgi:hypothetical protein
MLMKIKSYATKINERYSNSASHVVTLRERWTMTYNSATPRQQQQIDNMLSAAKFEFRRRNPLIKTWADLNLAEAKQVLMSSVRIDGSMQRKLDIDWVIELLTKFCSIFTSEPKLCCAVPVANCAPCASVLPPSPKVEPIFCTAFWPQSWAN